MKNITKKQLIKIDAEFLAVPYIADQFIDELGLKCLSQIPRSKFNKFLLLARQFREYAIGLSIVKKSRFQSQSRESGIRIRKNR